MTLQALEMTGIVVGGLVAALTPALSGVVAPENIRRGYPRDAMALALNARKTGTPPAGTLPVVGIVMNDAVPAKDAASGTASRYVSPPNVTNLQTATVLFETDQVQQQVDLIVVAGGPHGAQERDTVTSIVAALMAQTPSLPLPDAPNATADGSLGPHIYELTARVQPVRDRTDHRRDDDGLYRRDLTYTLKYARYAVQVRNVVHQVLYDLVPVIVDASIPLAEPAP